jgi:hypothetical protein
MSDDHQLDDHWMTYIEAGELLGLSKEAIRALARRHGWPRQSPNGIGLPVRVLVPADRLATAAANGRDRGRPPLTNGRDRGQPPSAHGQILGNDRGGSDATYGRDQAGEGATVWGSDVPGGQTFERPPLTNEQAAAVRGYDRGGEGAANGHDRRGPDAINEHDQKQADILRVMGKALEIFTHDLTAANERADRAERQVEVLQAQLSRAEEEYRRLTERWTAELGEQRRERERLVEQLQARRSWWPWRR